MKILVCHCGKHILVDDEDFEKVCYSSWSCCQAGGRVQATVKGENINIARLIISVPLGSVPDHVDGDTHDNRKCNLRVATFSQNQQNKRLNKNNSSGFKGVFLHKPSNKWIAQIRLGDKKTHLGLFTTPEEAAKAYNDAAKKHFGEFARVNNVKEEE